MDAYDRKELAENILVTMPLFFSRLMGSRGPKAGAHNFHLLLALCDNKDIAMTALSRQLNMSKSNLTVAVDKTVKDGLVERVFSENDRRMVLLRLTEKGAQLIEHHRRRMFDEAMEGLSILSEQDAEELMNHINGISRIVKKYM